MPETLGLSRYLQGGAPSEVARRYADCTALIPPAAGQAYSWMVDDDRDRTETSKRKVKISGLEKAGSYQRYLYEVAYGTPHRLLRLTFNRLVNLQPPGGEPTQDRPASTGGPTGQYISGPVDAQVNPTDSD